MNSTRTLTFLATAGLLTAAAAANLRCSSVRGLVPGKLGSAGAAAKLPSSSGAASGSPAKMAAAPKVAASADDPPEIKSIMRDLDDMESGAKGSGQIARFAAVSQDVGARLFYSDEVPVRTSPKLAALRDRYLALKKNLAAAAGGHASEAVGDGVPPKDRPTGDAERAAEDAVTACEATEKKAGYGAETDAREMAAQYAEYEQKLARARKVDAAAVKYRGAAIAVCELRVAQLRGANEDQYREEKAVVATERGCGRRMFSARAVMMGSKPGIYGRVSGSTSFSERVDCKQIPSGSKFPKDLKPAVDEFLDREKSDGSATSAGVVTFDGKFYTETDKEDLHVYKYADLTYFDKQMPFAANACGGKDAKLACEASGSQTARALNEIEFYVARADVHRKAGRADACKRLLGAAFSTSDAWRKDADEAKRSGKWQAGLKYKTKKGEVLTGDQIDAKIRALGKDADDRALGGACAKAGG